ncbi:hypothetical protein AGMMS49928_29800 [Spirochaetia bacterium]|nr:hypothetical protein AGMMS49928_29800 [Spirochaetia bacterium]
MNTADIKIFDAKKVRTLWNEDEEEWYFSIVDVVTVLTDSVDPAAYWRKLKQRLKEEGNETVTNCHGLKMPAPDGKMRLTDGAGIADIAGNLRAAFHDELCPLLKSVAVYKAFSGCMV